jgi:hypothetical protein
VTTVHWQHYNLGVHLKDASIVHSYYIFFPAAGWSLPLTSVRKDGFHEESDLPKIANMLFRLYMGHKWVADNRNGRGHHLLYFLRFSSFPVSHRQKSGAWEFLIHPKKFQIPKTFA